MSFSIRPLATNFSFEKELSHGCTAATCTCTSTSWKFKTNQDSQKLSQQDMELVDLLREEFR